MSKPPDPFDSWENTELKPYEERFWGKVEKTETCWLWTAGKDKDGYGKFRVSKKHYRAHRFSWELHFGPVPLATSVLHKCDNPPCVNPDHLFLGSNADNMADRDRKGRQAFGERQGGAVLTDSKVSSIRTMYGTGKFLQKDLARMFGISTAQMGKIVNNEFWRHLCRD